MTIHSVRHGFQAGIRAFKLLLGNSNTRTIFLIGLLLLSALFSFPVMKLIAKFSAPIINLDFRTGHVIWMILKSLFGGIAFVIFSLLWSILIVRSVLHPELTVFKLLSTSWSTVFSAIGFAALKMVGMLLLAPLYGILFPVVTFLVNFVSNFFFVQLVDERTLFIDTEKYKKIITHNPTDYLGVWLFSWIVGVGIVFIAGIIGLALTGILLEYQLFPWKLFTNPIFLFAAAFILLFTFLVASTVELVGVCLLYKDEEFENNQNGIYRKEQ